MRNRRSKIKIISICFALVAVCIVVSVFMSLIKSRNSMQYKLEKSEAGQNVFSKVSYKTYDAKGREITLTSEKVFEEKKENYVFDKIKSTFVLSNGEVGTITADTTKAIHSDKTVCDFIGNVRLSTDSGILMQTEKANVDFNKKIAKGDSQIFISKGNMAISSDKFYVDIDRSIVTLIGHARCVSDDNINSNQKNIKKGGQRYQKCRVSSEKMVVRIDNSAPNSIGHIEAIGNVSFSSVDYDLKSKDRVVYSLRNLTAESNVRLLYKKDGKDFDVAAGRMTAKLDAKFNISEATACGYLVIKTKDIRIKSDSGILRGNKIIASGNVAISNGGNNVFGDTAEFDIKTGSVSVKKSSGILSNKK